MGISNLKISEDFNIQLTNSHIVFPKQSASYLNENAENVIFKEDEKYDQHRVIHALHKISQTHQGGDSLSPPANPSLMPSVFSEIKVKTIHTDKILTSIIEPMKKNNYKVSLNQSVNSGLKHIQGYKGALIKRDQDANNKSVIESSTFKE